MFVEGKTFHPSGLMRSQSFAWGLPRAGAPGCQHGRMLYHLALAADWEQARRDGEYRVSTLGTSLDQEGFIHPSWSHQVAGVAARFYAAVTEPLVLLEIDEAALDVP